MNVVFWSCVPGMASVSSSLLATALSTAVSQHFRCSITQLQLKNNGLLPAVIIPSDSSGAAHFENVGIDALIRVARGGICHPEDVEGTAFSFIGKKLNVITESRQRKEGVYQNDLLPQLPQIFNLLNVAFRLNFIDVPAGVNVYSRQALELADIIVVCLPQTKWVVDYFFENYQFNKNKMFFLFGNYDSAQSVNVKNVMRHHPRIMTGKACSFIPHSTDYANAMNNSKTISFFMQNAKCNSNDSNYGFIKGCEDTAGKIIKMCGMGEE